jgi:soluble lytic murein transglycosylase
MNKGRRKIRIFFYVFGWFSLMLLFQNMTYVDFGPHTVPPVNETLRVSQAQELLGKKYHGSFAQKLAGQEFLNYHIYSKVLSSLPEKWKPKSVEIATAIIQESQAQELDPMFILAVIQTESGFNPDAKGSKGDSGLMQILPDTGEWIAEMYHIPWKGKKALFEPVYNIKLGVTYFAHLREEFEEVPRDYLRAFNMGPTHVRKSLKRKTKAGVQMNAHILNKIYARRVMRNYALIYKEVSSYDKSTR